MASWTTHATIRLEESRKFVVFLICAHTIYIINGLISLRYDQEPKQIIWIGKYWYVHNNSNVHKTIKTKSASSYHLNHSKFDHLGDTTSSVHNQYALPKQFPSSDSVSSRFEVFCPSMRCRRTLGRPFPRSSGSSPYGLSKSSHSSSILRPFAHKEE